MYSFDAKESALRGITREYNTNSMPKSDWTCEDIKLLILEGLDNRVDNKIPDLKRCQFGSPAWLEVGPYDEYCTPVSSDAEAYATVVAGFLLSTRLLRISQYEYLKQETYREIFTEQSADDVEKCSDFASIRAAVLSVNTELQEPHVSRTL